MIRARPPARVLRDQRRLIDALDAIEAKRLLDRLLAARPELLAEAAALAGHELDAVSAKRVSGEVAHAVGPLDVEDVWSRSGRHPDGSYVEENEAAWMVLEDAIRPFVEDLARRIRLGRDPEALALCQGTLLGLHRVEEAQGEHFLDGHAPDLLREAAGFVLETWKKTRGRRDARDWRAMRNFVSQSLPAWRRSMIRILGRAPAKGRRATAR